VTAEPAKTPSVARLAPVDSSLTAELTALEGARRALLSHDYSQSLRLLDDYTHRFPKRKLASEATVLRIEALAARGDRDAAARIGRDFLQNHPNGPYAQRVRSVIGDSSTAAH
jgi:TolA-binding protein